MATNNTSGKNGGNKENESAKPGRSIKKSTQHELIIVGVGASAGGLEALEEFFRNMPPNTNLAFCVVQHLSPDYKSLMGELLSRHTKLNIFRVEDGMKIEANSIYLIPPKKNMTIFHDHLYLIDQDHSQGLNLPIDIFLRSLAEDKGKNSIGIILSGTGSDGTLGIRAIKEAGGMVMAQEQQSAKFDGMPRSSIATGLVDYILPPGKMPGELVKYVRHPFITKKHPIESIISKDEDLLTKVVKIVKDHVGVDFAFYKPNTIIRRLEKRMSINQINKVENYITFLQQSPNEARILYKELLIGVTQFFRDPEAYDLIKEKAIPWLIRDKKPGTSLRIWTVGCSTGEEAYSLAILLKEYFRENDLFFDIKIFATDIDKDALEYAGTGIYPDSIKSDVSPERLNDNFTRLDKGYQVNESIRRMVIFATHNIISDPPFTKLDMISCRNLLIYLNSNTQKKIISMFYYSLMSNGILFLGGSESIGEMTKGFDPINNKWKVYKYRVGYKPPVASNFLIPSVNIDKRRIYTPDLGLPRSNSMKGFEVLFEGLLEEFVPPCVILDENYDIVHVFKDVNKFIKIQPGKLNFNILKMARKELSVIISSMLHKASKEKLPVCFKEVEIKDNEHTLTVNLNAKYLEDKNSNTKYFLITFEQIEKQSTTKTEKLDLRSEYTDQYFELEKELQFTKENLQATIEEVETSNEELQSTNEELIAANEELQSTNEELQSVNEELYTVNSEYQNKIEELTQLNNDINNLLRNTNIATLFLDTRLLIRKFTPTISSIFNIIEQDIGRPINHITHILEYRNLVKDINLVLDTLKPKEFEVNDRNRNTYLMKITPYRTIENAVEGIVITVVDISNRVQMEEKIKREQNLLVRVLENSPTAKTVVDHSGKIIFANRRAVETLGLTKSKALGRKYNSPKWQISDLNGQPIPQEHLPFDLIIKSGEELHNFQHYIGLDDGTRRLLSISGAPMFDEKGSVTGAVFSLEDITHQHNFEEGLKRERELLMRVLNISQEGTMITDKTGKIIFSNKAAGEIFGMASDEINKREYNDNEWEITDIHGNKIADNELPFRWVINTKKELNNVLLVVKSPKNGRITINTNATPIFDDNKNVMGVVFSIRKV